MRVSLNWLKEYVNIDMSPDELAHLLTMSGLEVEGVEPLGQSLQGVLVARILSLKLHPEADLLYVCRVDTGKGEVPVVCSAPNLAVGALVPMAPPGVRLPGGMIVKEGRIRGERSEGMLLAEDEMALTDDHTGIMVLPDHLEPGSGVVGAMSLEDHALEISLTPNRPDCASLLGIAREIAALTGQELKRPEIEIEESWRPIEDLTSITVDDPKGCPRYSAGMILGVELKPSPFWLRRRLYVSGVRGINNVVDVTNYVMLELGQPLHAFDYDRLSENRIVVRRAKEGEPFSTLDGKTHALSREHLMICDGERPVGLAGIMGGLNSEIFAGSKNILLESAHFDPVTIRRGAKRLGISTEASFRFERGVDIEGVIKASQRALMLMARLAGGEIAKGIIDNYPSPYVPPTIDFSVKAANHFLGTSLSRDTMAGYLRSLEMDVGEADENRLLVRPPSFRVDIARGVDLMEEVARLDGYDNIPVTSPHIRPPEEGDAPELIIADRVREIMVGMGFSEIISYSFISPEAIDWLGAGDGSPWKSFVRLLNPLSQDQSVMRTSLLPGLLSAVRTNISHGEKDLRLFEWGKIFLHRDEEDLPLEKICMAAVMTGLYQQKSWYNEERIIDFYDIKGVLEGLLKGLGIVESRFQKGETAPGYDPDIFAEVSVSGSVVGRVGQVFPETMERFDLPKERACILELDIDALAERLPATPHFQPFARFPAVFRDISLIVDRGMRSSLIREIAEREGKGLVEQVHLFDLYAGERIDLSEKALNFRICYRSKDRTLDGKEINLLHESIIDRIREETGGRLREG